MGGRSTVMDCFCRAPSARSAAPRYLRAGAAEAGLVGVEHAAPSARDGHPHPVTVPVDGEKLHMASTGLPSLSFWEGHAVVGGVVVGAEPLEALPVEVLLPQLLPGEVELVGGLEEVPELSMLALRQQVPVQRLLKVPLVPLAELGAHHPGLFPGMEQHVSIKRADARRISPRRTAGHLVEGALHVHHIVVGQGGTKFSGKRT